MDASETVTLLQESGNGDKIIRKKTEEMTHDFKCLYTKPTSKGNKQDKLQHLTEEGKYDLREIDIPELGGMKPMTEMW